MSDKGTISQNISEARRVSIHGRSWRFEADKASSGDTDSFGDAEDTSTKGPSEGDENAFARSDADEDEGAFGKKTERGRGGGAAASAIGGGTCLKADEIPFGNIGRERGGGASASCTEADICIEADGVFSRDTGSSEDAAAFVGASANGSSGNTWVGTGSGTEDAEFSGDLFRVEDDMNNSKTARQLTTTPQNRNFRYKSGVEWGRLCSSSSACRCPPCLAVCKS